MIDYCKKLAYWVHDSNIIEHFIILKRVFGEVILPDLKHNDAWKSGYNE